MSKKRQQKSGKLSYLIAFLIGMTVAIATVSYIFKTYDMQFLNNMPERNAFYIKSAIYVVSILFFGAIACFSTPFIIRWAFKLGNRFESTLSDYSSKDVTSGTIGLVLGLLIAFLISDLYKYIEVEPFKTMLSIITYIIFAFIGIRLGMKYIGEIIIVNKKPLSKQTGMENYKILDSSVIIDGRILELVRTGFLEGPFIIPVFIVNQLKNVAENTDMLKRNRGRRGLDIINSLKGEEDVSVIMNEVEYPDIADIDTKILKLAQQFNAKVITNDYNLNKLATVMQVKVLNINELSNAIKPVALPGESMTVNIVKPGKEAGQGIGYLDDGTLIVVENGGEYIGKEMQVTVTTTLQTNAGRMIFTRVM